MTFPYSSSFAAVNDLAKQANTSPPVPNEVKGAGGV